MNSNPNTPNSQLVGKLENVEIRFAGNKIMQVDHLEIEKNRIHVLSGPSGSGKTTLLRAFNRLNECFNHSLTTGEIQLVLADQWIDVSSLKLSQLPYLRRKVAMVFQAPNVLPTSIENNLKLPLKVTRKIKGPEASEVARLALEQAHLWQEVKDRLEHPAHTLSGGQQQRLCLARALALNPEILLLDEPTASLDPQVTEQIEDLILELKKDYSIIMVSHSRRQTNKLADRHCLCEHGTIQH